MGNSIRHRDENRMAHPDEHRMHHLAEHDNGVRSCNIAFHLPAGASFGGCVHRFIAKNLFRRLVVLRAVRTH